MGHGHGKSTHISSGIATKKSAGACLLRKNNTHHGEEEVERDQGRRSGVTERKAEALAQFRGQPKSAKRRQEVRLGDDEPLQGVRHLPVAKLMAQDRHDLVRIGLPVSIRKIGPRTIEAKQAERGWRRYKLAELGLVTCLLR